MAVAALRWRRRRRWWWRGGAGGERGPYAKPATAIAPGGAVGAGLLKVDVRHALGAERVEDRRRVAPAWGWG